MINYHVEEPQTLRRVIQMQLPIHEYTVQVCPIRQAILGQHIMATVTRNIRTHGNELHVSATCASDEAKRECIIFLLRHTKVRCARTPEHFAKNVLQQKGSVQYRQKKGYVYIMP